MARTTLMDVAKHCGVSRATVSLVLNDSPLVNEKTAEKVRKAMAEVGYVKNRAAASLRTQRSDVIGVVLTQITNPYFAEFAAGLQDALAASGSVPLLAISNDDVALQRQLVRSLVERNVDGIVLVPAHGTHADDLPDLVGTPLVLLARRLPGAEVDYVGAQNHHGGYAAAEHLHEHGCQTIAFVGGFDDSSAREERAGGVASFLTEHDLKFEAYQSVECEPERPQARAAALHLLKEHPDVDGIVCFNDVVAFGVLDAIADAGLTLGSQVRVIGFDDVHDAGLNRPSLSSVAVPARETGARAAQIVLERALGQQGSVLAEEFPVQLERRETCGCPRPPAQA